ncbi:metallophosphoesterase family protein [Lachnobacterium bovis]|uniref:Phosphoesterase n=1 Tax=Lachnobacterium bovis TaxID=140626 RepID=A0A1H9RQT1_9FIRM|nr:metallophosphoesterase [Lachnobacterium bovis]SER74888.1 hypothetical protein SAMN02910429_00950 [Lachnobacterium bovis]
MKILVLSDSHGDVASMCEAVRQEMPDVIFHLGDLIRDAKELHNEFKEIPFFMVPGNCDGYGYDDIELSEKVVELEGKRFLLLHGHTRGVKLGYMSLEYRARELEVDAALFGHTHVPYADYFGETLIFNPGSIGQPHYGQEPTYGILEIVDGELEYEHVEFSGVCSR